MLVHFSSTYYEWKSRYLVTENVAVKHRYWIGIAFNMAYPIGFLYMALIANFVFEWRDIQLYLTIPAASLIVFW